MSNQENRSKTNPKSKKKVKVYQKRNKGPSEKAIIENLQSQYENINTSAVRFFTDFPLSSKTLKGLKDCGYKEPTEIQRETIGPSLKGADILGAAKTGSGKTLAFIIPILEALYCRQWTRLDGVGAVVITPTRELAYQIFETLKKVGIHHDFSAGLIIGGKDLKFERKRMDQCNIVICTPGRLLQHMDENPLFDCVNMKVLVLDEADRCLDMGFQETMNAIIANLPPKRQTLLFSATQTKSVKDLVRLSLKDPAYISVHEHSEHSTPSGLQQSYVVCELHDKISVLWSFIRNHLKQKIIVFFSSCKQVKFVYEMFCRLRPGVSLLALYGTLHQMRRMEIYESFCKKNNAVLFATDIAARGLDFPAVHWVVQADCPEDSATYIHRVGRTARYHRGGESLLLLLPSEHKPMLEALQQRKIPINEIEINPKKLQNPIRKMEAFLARDPTLKDTAQRAFVAYVKSVFLMKDKNIFDVQALNTDAFAKSLGLVVTPRIRFLQRFNARKEKQQKIYTVFDSPEEGYGSDSSNDEPQTAVLKMESKHAFNFSNDSDSEDDILKVKRLNHEVDMSDGEELPAIEGRKKKKALTKAAMAKKILKKKIVPNKKIVFDDEGEAVLEDTKEKKSQLARDYENENVGGIDIEKARKVLREEDKFDKQRFKEKVKAKHREEKRKLREMKKREQEQEERDEFGENSDQDEPDLSWLPDPDKIYKEENNSADGNESKKNHKLKPVKNKDVESRMHKSVKRKLLKVDKRSKKPKMSEDIGSSLSVNEAEQLALMLLNNK